MCGLAGLFNFEAGDVATIIRTMTEIIRHRGPDDEGYVLLREGNADPEFLGGPDTPDHCFHCGLAYAPSGRIEAAMPQPARVALGHRRLAILDLSAAGHQPLTAVDNRYLIVFNGEIYNYRELRDQLAEAGHRFVSQSDTETIVLAYHEWGPSCLTRFNGMFAFIILDRLERKLFLARDRFGVKPLYYWFGPQGYLAVASEIKQFTVLPGWQAVLNGPRAYDFLNWCVSDHMDETLFRGVLQLRGGDYVECRFDALPLRGTLPVQRWYHLPTEREETNDFSTAADRFRELFFDAVRLRLQADVPVGTCLSGGLDSSAIVCSVNRLLLQVADAAFTQQTFSACSDIARYDERRFVDAVVDQTGVEAHYTFPRQEELFDLLDGMVWHQDEPFPSTSIYAEWHVFKLVSTTRVKVTLDGHGADELLAGYHTFWGPRFAELLRGLRLSKLWDEVRSLERAGGRSAAVRALKHTCDVLTPELLRQRLRRALGLACTKTSWLDSEVLGVREYDPLVRLGNKAVGLNRFSEIQLLFSSLPVQLHWSDRDSMAHSIESRAPFLDYRLVEFIIGCPPEYKLADGVSKRLLRQALGGILPPEVAGRIDKMGFVTPEEVWVREEQPERFREVVREAVDLSGGILRGEAIDLADAIISGRMRYDAVLFRLICFGRWMRKFNVQIS